MELNKIHQGDCLELMKDIEDKAIDCIITDPPYGIGINKMNFVTSGAVKVGGAYRNDYSDHPTDWDSKGLTIEQFKEMQRISKNQIIFGGNNFASILPNSRCWVVWDKRVEDKYSNDFADCELAWTSFNKPSRMIRFLWSGMIQEKMNWKEKRVHPTQKPIDVMRQVIKLFTEGNNLILDPFCGSGSTCIACKQLNRRFIGIEKEKKYVDIANERLKQGNLNTLFQKQTNEVNKDGKIQ